MMHEVLLPSEHLVFLKPRFMYESAEELFKSRYSGLQIPDGIGSTLLRSGCLGTFPE